MCGEEVQCIAVDWVSCLRLSRQDFEGILSQYSNDLQEEVKEIGVMLEVCCECFDLTLCGWLSEYEIEQCVREREQEGVTAIRREIRMGREKSGVKERDQARREVRREGGEVRENQELFA